MNKYGMQLKRLLIPSYTMIIICLISGSSVRFLLVMELRRLRSSRNQVRKRLAVGSGLAVSHPIWSLLSWSQWDREWLLSRVRCLKVARCWSIRFHALAGGHWRNGGDGPEHIWWWRSWRSAARTLIMWEFVVKTAPQYPFMIYIHTRWHDLTRSYNM